MAKLEAIHTGDYFHHIPCSACQAPTKNLYLAFDRAMPRFKATCEKCRERWHLKLDMPFWSGLPARAAKTRGRHQSWDRSRRCP